MESKRRFELVVVLRPDPQATLWPAWAHEWGNSKWFRVRITAEGPIEARRRVIGQAQGQGAFVARILKVTERANVE